MISPLHITTFGLSDPDESGVRHSDLQCALQNETNETVRLLRTTTLVSGPDGVAYTGEQNMPVDITLPPGAICEFSPSLPLLVAGTWLGDDRHRVRVDVHVTLCSCAELGLGRLTVPGAGHHVVSQTRAFTPQEGSPRAHAVLSVVDRDSHDSLMLRCAVLVEGVDPHLVERVAASYDLVDRRGAEIRSFQLSRRPTAGGLCLLEMVDYVAREELKGASAIVTALYYRAVAWEHAHARAEGTQAADDAAASAHSDW